MTAPETAFDRLVAALEPLGGLRRRGDHADARCPSHEDRNPSLSVDHGDGRALVKCQAGCSAEQVVAALGLTLSDLFDEPRQAGGDDGWTPLAAEGGRLVATYHYTDEHGRLLHATARIVMPDGRKQFRQWQPDPSKPSGRRWSLNGTRRVLYRLPEVIAAVDAGRVAYIVEGEKDVHAVEAAGGVATTSPMGAGKWRVEYAEPLRGAEVVIVADRDAPGIAHARTVAASLDGVAASVRLVQAAEGKDAADHLAAGHGLDDFLPLDGQVEDGAAELVADVERFLGAINGGGAELLDEVFAALTRYVVFPTLVAAYAVALWVAATHAQPAWEHATRLVIKSPLKRCGKTRLQEVIADLAHNVLRTSNTSIAALVRSIDEDDPPTLMLDEADAVFAKRRGERSEGAEDLRGILNSGHSRGWPYIRWDMHKRVREECPTFAMAAISGIGDLPDTIEDRAVVVTMVRRAAGEKVAAYRARRARPELQRLGQCLQAWLAPSVERLTDAEPAMPVEDRAADVWEALVAVADLAGGDWPERARDACKALTSAVTADDATLGERLLADLRDVFGAETELHTKTLLARLHALDEAPWGDYFGHPLAARDVARLLRPYGVRSCNVRLGEAQAKGYTVAKLADAWRRYVPAPDGKHPDEGEGGEEEDEAGGGLPPRAHPSQPSQPSQEGESAGQPWDGNTSAHPSHIRPTASRDGWDGNGTDGSSGIRPKADLRKQGAGTAGTAGTDERAGSATATPEAPAGSVRRPSHWGPCGRCKTGWLHDDSAGRFLCDGCRPTGDERGSS